MINQSALEAQQSNIILVRGSIGGRSSSIGRSSSSSRSTSKSSGSTKGSTSTKSTKSTSKTTSSQKGTSTAKPGSTVKTSDGKTVKSSTAKPSNAKYSKSEGIVGDNGYKPTFTNGYTPPVGSVVYYPNHSFIDYLPWIYLFSHDSPRNDTTTVVQPDGKQVQAKPEQGFDGLAVFNWLVLIVVAIALVAGIVWLVNRLTNKKNIRNAKKGY